MTEVGLMGVFERLDRSYNTACAWEDWRRLEKKALNDGYEEFVSKLRPLQNSSCEAIELQTIKLQILLQRKSQYDEALKWLDEDQLS